MNVIDYRILVQASPEVVWQIISDVKRNPEWQVNCKAVSILTHAGQGGQGLSWRATSDSGKDYVVRITAWYDRLGYEYTFTDGTPYKDSKGQIRLQETVEGTLIQWTFQYDMPGVIGGLKNSLGRKRAIEKDIIDSLQNLYKIMSRIGAEMRFESKSLMRDAPDVRARQQYKPRHPSVFDQPKESAGASQAAPPTESARAALNPFTNEPPKADDDTRPRVTVKQEPVADAPTDRPETPPAAATSTFDDSIAIFRPPEDVRTAPVPEPEEPARAELEAASATERVQSETPIATEQQEAPAVAAPVKPDAEAPAPIGVDTAAVSVFDLFGIPRPSATQESKAVKVDPEPQPRPMPEQISPVETAANVPGHTAEPTVDAPPTPKPSVVAIEDAPTVEVPAVSQSQPATETRYYHRVGLRYKLRYHSVKLHRPSSGDH